MNTIFKIMAFSIMLNISIGIMMAAIPAFGTNPSTRGGLDYQEGHADVFTGELEQEVQPTGLLEDEGNAIYRILDMLSLGFIKRFINTITNYAYGFIKLLENILGPVLLEDNPTLYNILFGRGLGAGFGVLYLLMTIGYIYGAWYLWTGKDLRD